jgi:hypothetical protein
MADRAATDCTIYDCPEDKRAEALDVIREHFSNVDWCEAIGDELDLGATYTESELAVGLEGTIAQELFDLGCTGEVHQDAKYEFDASIYMFAPDLGIYGATSTQSGGDVMLTSDEIEQAIDTVRRSRQDEPFDLLVEELHRRTGKLWRDRLEQIQAKWQREAART